MRAAAHDIPPIREPQPHAADAPALLLPVRIETRFSDDRDQPELWVRIFPDQIAIDSFEPEVTDNEVTGATTYWTRLWRAGTSDDVTALAAWRALCREFGAPRAAYLAQHPDLQPANLAQRPATATPDGSAPVPAPVFTAPPPAQRRPASWSRPPLAAAMPERFTVVLERGRQEVGRFTGEPVAPDLAVGPDPSAPAPAPVEGEPAIDDGLRWLVDFDAAVAVGMGLRIALSRADHDRGFDRIVVLGLRRQAPGTTAAASSPRCSAPIGSRTASRSSGPARRPTTRATPCRPT